MQKWEHHRFSENVDRKGRDRIDQELARLGREGWELVAVVMHGNGPSTDFFLKRAIPQ